MKRHTLFAGAALGALSVFAAATVSPPALSATYQNLRAQTPPNVAPCPSSSVSASADFTQFGGSASSLAGAVVFRNTGVTACSLRGVPQVHVVSNGGQAIATYQAPTFATHLTAAILRGRNAAHTAHAGSSITISSWTCTMSSFSLTVRFSGWARSIPAMAGSPSGSCPPSQEVDETVYVGPVTTLRG